MKYKCCDYSFPDWLRAAGANLCKQISSTLMGYAHIGVTGASCQKWSNLRDYGFEAKLFFYEWLCMLDSNIFNPFL